MNILSHNSGLRSIFVLIVAGMFFGAQYAQAISISPARIEINGNPGETITKEMLLINESEDTSIFYSSFSNFEASGDTGNPSFAVPKDGIGTWMMTSEEISLKPKESKKVNLVINIPKNADPGGHFGAVFWGNSSNNVNSGVSIGAKTGVLVLLSVSGDVKENAGLVEFNTKDNKTFYNTLPVSFFYRFKNDGGDRIKPVGKIVMRDLFYIPEDRIDANPSLGNVLPGSTRKFEVDWVKNPRAKDYVAPDGKFAQFFDTALYQWQNFAVGPYFAKMSLLYGTDATRVSKTVFFFVFPWQLLICLIVIFVIVFWGGRKLIRRYNRHIIQKARIGMNTPVDANHV